MMGMMNSLTKHGFNSIPILMVTLDFKFSVVCG